MIILSVSACASAPEAVPLHQKRPLMVSSGYVDLHDSKQATRRLYRQLNQWRSVKYKLGGISKNGVDCSGFVLQTFKTQFGIHLPRSTSEQSRLGRSVPKTRLRAGDLVFFKTGSKNRHVGIYVENGRFIHASTSEGVTLSRLDNVYWSKKYWKSIRLS